MKRAVVLVVLACAPAPWAVADDMPPMPAPVAPAVERLQPTRSTNGAADSPRAGKSSAGPVIKLGQKQLKAVADGSGAGFVDEGEVTMEAKDGQMSAILNNAAYSHSFYGVPSQSVASIRLVQEFEIVAGDSRGSMITVSLSARLRATFRAERNEKATAALRVADAAIAVPGGSPFLWLGFPPYQRCGPVSERFEQEGFAGSVLLPPGHYVLVANLRIETAVDSCLRGHAEVLFAPPAEGGTWKSAENPAPKPRKGEDHHFGFIIAVSASSNGG